MDFTEARRFMVDGQIRPNKVTDPRILDAMREVPRERFVPPALAFRVMADADTPLRDGRVMMQAMTLARLLQSAAVLPGQRVLVVAAGTGYSAAVLRHIGAEVVALESNPELLAAARANLAMPAEGSMASAAAAPVRVESGPLAEGWAAAAPYDAILIDGAVDAIPPALRDQLAEGGRIVGVIRAAGGAGRAVLARRTHGSFGLTETFDAQTARLPDFAAAAAPAPAGAFQFV
ncbi:protein-L-isoaspartate O-methyltransferase family protein [Roseomonas elaeocarpi]|uniref:Protein-L-isoaspartate O-methyltransferase n=1 Tax=Roseomonas elaeocarpi TaxID=907779 RepID=A0ABV6JXV4_9PROT